MSCLADKFRDCLWSELCLSNVEAYRAYLVAFENGLRLVTSGDLDGATEFIGRERGRIDYDVSAKSAFTVGGAEVGGAVVDRDADSGDAVGAEDNVDRGAVQGKLGLASGGVSAAGVGRCDSGTAGGGIDAGLQSSNAGVVRDAAVDGRPVGLPLGHAPRGPNYERNKANRDAQKLRKQRRRAGSPDGVSGRAWRQSSRFGDGAVVNAGGVEQKGFWNSCSPEVRQRLIDSKARMHEAENLRKAKEAELRANDVGSPYELMLKAVKMAEFAKKQQQSDANDKITGWAKTVATSSAESLARSVPSSVPSYDELEQKLAASSQSSFELELSQLRVEKDAKEAELIRMRLDQKKKDADGERVRADLEKRVKELELYSKSEWQEVKTPRKKSYKSALDANGRPLVTPFDRRVNRGLGFY